MPQVLNVLPGIIGKYVHAFHPWRGTVKYFAHLLSKRIQSQNVGLTMIVLPKWPALKNIVKILVDQQILVNKGSNVMLSPLILVDPLLHAPVLKDNCQTTRDIAYQVCSLHHIVQFHIINLYSITLVIAQSECQVNDNCQDTHLCHQGSCQNACRFTSCGQNAFCDSYRHEGHCKCFDGFVGNPLQACQKRKYSYSLQ